MIIWRGHIPFYKMPLGYYRLLLARIKFFQYYGIIYRRGIIPWLGKKDGYCKKLESLRAHGKGKGKYDINYMGMNARLDTIQAAILLSKLEIFDWELKERDRIAKIYTDELNSSFHVPVVPENTISAWAQYTLQTKNRKKILNYLKENNIPVMVYYPKPMHQQTAYKEFMLNENLSTSSDLSRNVFSIPVHAYLTDLQLEYIIENLKKAKKLFL